MFTGLIEAVGRVAAVVPMAGGVRLAVETALAPRLAIGDSVAHNGVCLTLVDVAGGVIVTEVSPETLRVTNLGTLAAGSLVNLERPVRPDGPMGGHFVQGHVDGTGTVRAVVKEGDFWRFTFTHPEGLAPLLIPKGSIAVDGISLTVAALRPGEFDVQIVPHTWAHTNLQARQVGELVNLEGDMLGKYVLRIAEIAGWTGRAPLAPAGGGGSAGGR
jgi:riboflavin synthase alpha subunit